MASNPYYRYFDRTNEQNLMEDLVVESIKQYAHDFYYLPRNINILDKLMTEPVTQSFKHALGIEGYVLNWSELGGAGLLLAKFDLEIRDNMKFIISKKSHNEFIKPTTKKERPWEGDCLYIPMLKNTYQISYVSDSNPAFYILGKNYAWEVTADLLEFNNEHFDTGNPVIDNLNPPFQHADSPTYNLESYDKTAQNKYIQDESDEIIDWTEKNPFGEP